MPIATVAIVAWFSVAPPAPETGIAHLYDRLTLKPTPEGGGQTATATKFAWVRDTVQAQQIEMRLAELRAAAADDGITWSEASEEALRAFLQTYRQPARPMIVHLANGNLRAIWEDGAERHVGLQFKGPDDLQYVFLVRRPGASFVSQVTGRDATAPVIDQLKALGLYDLVTS